MAMKKFFLVLPAKALAAAGCLLLVAGLSAQTASQRLQKAFQKFESDSQLKHAISSLYVIDAKTGEVVFDKNSQVGLAGASTQKIITAATAFELLGKDFRYKTEFGTGSDPEKSVALWIKPSGDPTFGSWRWEATKEENVIKTVVNEIKKENSRIQHESVMIDAAGWSSQNIPDGWIWQDIGNYYGAGSDFFNWRENQYDLFLKSGSKVGDEVSIAGTSPELYTIRLYSEVRSAVKGSGDNAYIYLPDDGYVGIVRGTIPVDEDSFRISGSIPNPMKQFLRTLEDSLAPRSYWKSNFVLTLFKRMLRSPTIFYTHYSPSLDSIIYWFLKKSVNLYGEALLKTFSYEKQGFGSTDSGLVLVKKFWKEKGLDDDELNLYDGSGLSPLNRITTHAQVEVLKYAKSKDWFQYFYDALPEFNGMKMKSGTIADVKGFCGYQKSKDGKEYIFSFIVNNYSGSGISSKIYKVLDELK